MNAKGCGRGISRGIPTKTRRKKIGAQEQTLSNPPLKTSYDGIDGSRLRRPFPTDYCGLMKLLPESVPTSLIKGIITNGDETGTKKKENPGLGKVSKLL